MSILSTHDHVAELQLTLEARGLRQAKAFRKHCSALRYAARTRDMDAIRAEAMASKPKTWADF